MKIKGDIEVQRIQIRGIARLAEEAERTQRRLDKIGLKALPQFLPSAKPQDVKEDWMENFISHAGKARDDDAETLWARILAGEVNKPGTYSKRTLEVLSLMTQQEAELFVRAGQYAVFYGGHFLVPREQSFYPENSGLAYGLFMELADIGLFHQTETHFVPFQNNVTEAYFSFSNSTIAVNKNPTVGHRLEPTISAWVMTRAGRELGNLFEWQPPPQYVESFRKGISQLGWISRLGKLVDVPNPHFEETSETRTE